MQVLRVGIISDTHGMLREEAVSALQGSDSIVHAGDVGKPEILEALRKIAPVTAVRGNIDRGDWAEALPMTATVETGPALIYVLHDVNTLDIDPLTAGFDIVISGHSHKPEQAERESVLYLNPGSAGPRRFRLPITVATLHLNRRPWRAEFVELVKSG